MKTQINNRFGGGLIVLIMLTVAVVAGQTKPNFEEPAASAEVFEPVTGSLIAIDERRLKELKALASVVDTFLELPIRIEMNIEASEAPVPEIADSTESPVQ